jgi:hypothetical protein
MKHSVRFLPLLALYVLLVVSADSPQSSLSDAGRYLWFAKNLTEGHYSPETKMNLWSGPGYPLVLAPLVAMDLAPSAGAILNIGFMFGAVLYFFYTARRYVGSRNATVATYILGLWPPAVRMVPVIMTEPLAVFLACGFAYHVSSMHEDGHRRGFHIVAAAAYLAYLALTRVIFGYVIPVVAAVLLVAFLVRRGRALRRDIVVCFLALGLCLPYLYYTYSLTGRVYYWSDSGGLSLYWMASPYEGELGDWHPMRAAARDSDLSDKHSEFFSGLGALPRVEVDQALRHRAIENIKAHPGKYARNWVANVGRLLFGYPRTQSVPKLRSLLDVVPGMFLTVISTLCLYPTWAGRRRIPHAIWVLLAVAFVYFGESSLLSALHRFTLPAIPICFLWISFVLTRIIDIRFVR